MFLFFPRYYRASSLNELDQVVDFGLFKLVYARKFDHRGVLICRVYQLEVY